MADYEIKCDVIHVDEGVTCQEVGDCFVIGKRTPAAMCCLAFAAVYPPVVARRFSEKMAWETPEGCFDVTCPDRHVIYRLTRIKGESISEQDT